MSDRETLDSYEARRSMEPKPPDYVPERGETVSFDGEPTTAYTRKHYGMHCACATTVDRLTAEVARLREALGELARFADSVLGEPDKALISFDYGTKLVKEADAAIAAAIREETP